MSKKIRKAVRTFLIKENQIIAIKYKTEKNKDYYDVPGGKIEDNQDSVQASIREFKEETGIEIVNQKYKGNVIIEYPNKIFDFDIYIVDEYNGIPVESNENYAMWVNINSLLNESKLFPSIEIIKYIDLETMKLKIYSDDNHHVLKIENIL